MKPVFSLLALLFGTLLLLPLLAWSSLQDPGLNGMSPFAAALGKLFSPRTAWATVAGMGAVVLGIAGLLDAALLEGVDRHERKRALPVWWAALGVGAVAMLVLLLVVSYLGLQAGEAAVISRWVNR
jgi:hypothetical protein